MATIKEVAKMAGVSPSTVSRVMAGKIYVEPDKVDQVMQAMETLNYHPNPLAKGLRVGRANMLGVILPDISNTFFSLLIKSIETHAAKNGYSIMLSNTNEDAKQEKIALQQLSESYIDGLAIIPVCYKAETFDMLNKRKIPYVLVNRWTTENVNCVSNDQRGGCYDVMQYLIKCGHRKISVMFRSFEQDFYRDRYNGCMDALKEHGLAACEKYFLHDVNSLEESQQAVENMLAQDDRPTALFITSEIFTFGAYSAIFKRGMSIPKDISVIGFDNLPTSPYMTPPLTTYHQAIERIGEYTVANLIKQINKKQELPEKTLLRGSIIPRDSVKIL